MKTLSELKNMSVHAYLATYYKERLGYSFHEAYRAIFNRQPRHLV